MPTLQIQSVSEPLASSVVATFEAAHLVARAQFVGAVPSLPEGQELGPALVRTALTGLSERGVARDAALMFPGATTSQQYLDVVRAAAEQMEQSPLPDSTWPVVLDVLGEELLAVLVDVSPASLKRYKAKVRSTPDAVARRLHFLALLLADLAGAYNDAGTRRWFSRPRHQLDGASPLQLLRGGFDPDGVDAARVRALVNGLAAAGAT